jgi:hypothetical protein
VDEHLQGVANRRLLIWSLIYLENLIQIFMGDRSSFEHRAPSAVKSKPDSILAVSPSALEA